MINSIEKDELYVVENNKFEDEGVDYWCNNGILCCDDSLFCASIDVN